MNKIRCATCVHRHKEECRRFPPTLSMAYKGGGIYKPTAFYPSINIEADWCGEYKSHEKPPVPIPAPEPKKRGGSRAKRRADTTVD